MMSIQGQIKAYIDSLPEPKRSDVEKVHYRMLDLFPDCQLWFLDGKNSENKVVSNPNIGYGHQVIEYADGKAREFYKIGISANTGGISVYILGIDDKAYLAQSYGGRIGKASITGYCIKFKSLKDINTDVLEEAMRDGFKAK